MTERKAIAGDFPRTLQPWASLVPPSLAAGTPKPVVKELVRKREKIQQICQFFLILVRCLSYVMGKWGH